MKKNDLKRMLKPLIKECVQEMILEEGLLKNIVSEVASGMQGNLVTETKQTRTREPMIEADMQERSNKARRKLNEHRKRLMDSIGKDAYGGVNVFEGLDVFKEIWIQFPKNKRLEKEINKKIKKLCNILTFYFKSSCFLFLLSFSGN